MLTLNKRPLLILRDAGKGFCFVFIRFVLFLERVRKYQTIVRLGSKNKSCGKVPKKKKNKFEPDPLSLHHYLG